MEEILKNISLHDKVLIYLHKIYKHDLFYGEFEFIGWIDEFLFLLHEVIN